MENLMGSGSKDKARDDLKTLLQDGEDLLKQSEQSPEKNREVRARLAAAVEAAKEAGYRLEEKAVASAKATDRVIREHPYHSIGVAFALGVLIGVLVNRR